MWPHQQRRPVRPAVCSAPLPPALLQTPFEQRGEVGRLRLLRLLRRTMIRASKRELLNLGIPPLLYTASRRLLRASRLKQDMSSVVVCMPAPARHPALLTGRMLPCPARPGLPPFPTAAGGGAGLHSGARQHVERVCGHRPLQPAHLRLVSERACLRPRGGRRQRLPALAPAVPAWLPCTFTCL